MWHCEHSPLAGWAASATLNWPAVACGRVWNPRMPFIGYWFIPSHTELVSWHDVQAPVAPACTMAAVGAGDMKPVPGSVVFVALPAITPTGTFAKWQFSHRSDVGTCEAGPGPFAAGMTTMLVMPKKLLLVTLGP